MCRCAAGKGGKKRRESRGREGLSPPRVYVCRRVRPRDWGVLSVPSQADVVLWGGGNRRTHNETKQSGVAWVACMYAWSDRIERTQTPKVEWKSKRSKKPNRFVSSCAVACAPMLPYSYDQGLADDRPRSSRSMMSKKLNRRGLESHANKSNRFRSGLGDFVKTLRSETHEGQKSTPALSLGAGGSDRSFFRSLPALSPSRSKASSDSTLRCVDPGPACCCYVRPAISRVRATLANRSIEHHRPGMGEGAVASGWGSKGKEARAGCSLDLID